MYSVYCIKGQKDQGKRSKGQQDKKKIEQLIKKTKGQKQRSQNLMQVRFCKNAGTIRVHFLLKTDIMRILKAKNEGILLKTCRYYVGISKGAMLFSPFLGIQTAIFPLYL